MAFLQMQNGDHLWQWKKRWKSLAMPHLLCMRQQFLWKMLNLFHRSTTLLKGLIMSFVGREKVPKFHCNGVPMRVNGKPQMEEMVTIIGGPKADFLLEKGLNESSKPQEWSNAFLPIFDRKGKNPQNVNTQLWTHKWAFWMNQKAIFCSAGVPGGVYPSFTPFSNLEIECFLGLYILQGLNPSPQVEMKFNSQQVDPVQGNNLWYRMFGANVVV